MFHTILVFFYLSLVHPIHISLAEVEIDAEREMIELSIRVFTDDLELELSKLHSKRLSVDQSPKEELEEALLQYSLQKLQFHANGNKLDFILLGFEQEQDATWIYLEAKKPANISQLRINYSILFEIYDDQTNFLKLKNQGETKTFTFSKNKPSQICYSAK